MKPSGGSAVMADRRSPLDALDDFPTPPWGTRALMEVVFPAIMPQMGERIGKMAAWEPAANRGYMAEVLREYFAEVHASDVHDYGMGYSVGSFVGTGLDVIPPPRKVGWIITNPPFKLGEEFFARAYEEASFGVALLLRLAFLEGQDRYANIYQFTPPTVIAQFVERLPMVEGRYDPDAGTATAYAWFVWVNGVAPMPMMWIPPGTKERLMRPDDRERFVDPLAYFKGRARPSPLFDWRSGGALQLAPK